ncbi:putative transcription factor B3-Domain family [Helianthus annuus]|nr:putative transcription factor B3-Domain family [Helianthus annuus]
MEDLKKKDDPKAKTPTGVDKNQCLKDKSKFETDLDKFLIPKNKSHVYLLTKVDPTGKTNVVLSEPTLCSTYVVDAIPKYTIDVAQTVLPRKGKRLPSAVSDDLCFSIHNLRDVSLQNLRSEVTNMKTIPEKNGNGYRYGFSKWSAFLKSNQIHIGATLFFKYVKASQLLILTKVV